MTFKSPFSCPSWRRVKLERDAHRRLVASIRAHGLLAPLVVQPDDKNPGAYRVIAGNRRLAALREAYKDALRGASRRRCLASFAPWTTRPPTRWRWR